MTVYTKALYRDAIEHWGWDIGDFTYGQPAIIGREASLSIGKFCSIAGNVRIYLGHEHRTDWVSTYPFSCFVDDGWSGGAGIEGHPHTKGDVVIGDDVWLADSSVVLSGVTIGTGAVVATQCVVTRDVPPYAIVSGVPGKIRRRRFDDETIERLLKTQWWNRHPAEINALVPLILSTDPMPLLDWLEANPPQVIDSNRLEEDSGATTEPLVF